MQLKWAEISPWLLRPVERQTFLTELLSTELQRAGVEDGLIGGGENVFLLRI